MIHQDTNLYFKKSIDGGKIFEKTINLGNDGDTIGKT
jgi:hypothetical protein